MQTVCFITYRNNSKEALYGTQFIKLENEISRALIITLKDDEFKELQNMPRVEAEKYINKKLDNLH